MAVLKLDIIVNDSDAEAKLDRLENKVKSVTQVSDQNRAAIDKIKDSYQNAFGVTEKTAKATTTYAESLSKASSEAVKTSSAVETLGAAKVAQAAAVKTSSAAWVEEQMAISRTRFEMSYANAEAQNGITAHQGLATAVQMTTAETVLMGGALAAVVAGGLLWARFLFDSAEAYLEHTGKIKEFQASIDSLKESWRDMQIAVGAVLLENSGDFAAWASLARVAIDELAVAVLNRVSQMVAELHFMRENVEWFLRFVPGGRSLIGEGPNAAGPTTPAAPAMFQGQGAGALNTKGFFRENEVASAFSFGGSSGGKGGGAKAMHDMADATEHAGHAMHDMGDEAARLVANYELIFSGAATKGMHGLGTGILDDAAAMTAAINNIGGVSRLTAAEVDRVNKTLTQAVDKYVALGQAAPTALRDMWISALIPGPRPLTTLPGQQMGLPGSSPIPSLSYSSGIQGTTLPGQQFPAPTAPSQSFFAQAFGSSSQFGNQFASTIMGAIQGGGSVWEAGGSFIGSHLGQGLAKVISGGLGGWLGGALNALLPGIGSLLGPLLGKVGGFFKNLFGGNDTKALINETFGSYDALRQQLNALGDAGERMWIKLTQQTGKNDLASAKAQILQIQNALAQLDQQSVTVDLHWNPDALPQVGDLEQSYQPYEAPEQNAPPMARGGIVRARPGGTLVRVGEAGSDEAIVPLGAGGAGGGTAIIQLEGRTVAEIVVPHIPGVVKRYRVGTL